MKQYIITHGNKAYFISDKDKKNAIARVKQIKKLNEMSISQEDELYNIMLASSIHCEKKNEEKVKLLMKILASSFPMLVFDLSTLRFHDSAKNRKYDIRALIAPKYKYMKTTDSNYKEVSATISKLLNIKKETLQKIKKEIIEDIKKDLDIAVEKHVKKQDKMMNVFNKNMEKIQGIYDIDAKYSLYISIDPIDIFAKSTGEAWGKESCEQWTHGWKRLSHSFHAGIYSDIEWGNAVAFMIDKKTGERVARVMLRNALTNDKIATIGIEAIFYSIKGKINASEDESKLIAPGLKAKEAYIALVEVLVKHGINMDYLAEHEVAETPYEYEGYSDRMQAGSVKISYGKLRFDFTKQLSLENVDYYCDCPNCNLTIGWNIIFEIEKGATLADVKLFFDGHAGEIINDFWIPSNLDFEEITQGGYGRHQYVENIVVKTPPDFISDLNECPNCGWLLIDEGSGQWNIANFIYDDHDLNEKYGEFVDFIKYNRDWNDCEEYIMEATKKIKKRSLWYKKQHGGSSSSSSDNDIYAIDNSKEGMKLIEEYLVEWINQNVDQDDFNKKEEVLKEIYQQEKKTYKKKNPTSYYVDYKTWKTMKGFRKNKQKNSR